MNPGGGPPYQNKSKLIEEVQSWSPQIRDYYEKFGKKRDLEQYFLSHTYERRPPVQIIDSLELVEGRRCGFVEHGRGTYPEREINFETMEYEKQSSPDIEIREVHGPESSPSPRISLRSDTPALDVSPEQDFQDSAANVASPGTLSTSKKLEWDSLGDVGYDNARKGREARQNEQQYKYQRNEEHEQSPEFAKRLNYKVGDPTAHSTPNIDESSKSSLERKKSPEKSPRKSTGIHKKSGKYHLSYRSNKPTNFNVDVKKYYSFNVPTGEKSQYEEVQRFHIDARMSGPETKNAQVEKQSQVVVTEKVAEPSVKTVKTDREIQTTSRESVSMSVQTAHVDVIDENKSKEAASSRNDDLNIDLSNATRGSPNTLSRAESFEYIPGPIYENTESALARRKYLNAGNVQAIPTSPSDAPPQSTVRSITSEDIVKIFQKSNSSRDVDDCIHRVSKLLRSHSNNPSINKKVVKKIVKMLMQTNYPSDNEAYSRATTPSSSTPSVHKSDPNIKSSSTTGDFCEEPPKYTPDMDKYNNNLHATNKEKDVTTPDDLVIEEIHSADATHKTNIDDIQIEDNILNLEQSDNSKQDAIVVVKESIAEDKNSANVDDKNNRLDNVSEGEMHESARTGKKIAKQFENIHKLIDAVKLNKLGHRDGMQSAPSTLTYSHYLKKKAESVVSLPSTSYASERSGKYLADPSKNKREESQRKTKKEEEVSTDRSSYRDVNIAEGINNTHNELSKINEEILKLTILKLKLENKHRPNTLPALTLDINQNCLRNVAGQVDKGGSGDMTSRRPVEEPVLVYYNTAVSPTCEDDYTTSVPPLNLANSSSSACSLDVANEETKNSKSSRKSPCSCRCGESSQKSKDTSDPQTSGYERGTVRFVDSTDSVKCDDDPHGNSASKSSSGTSCSSDLCACCRCKVMCSQSSSSDSCTAQLRKYRKINDKYQKCKTMRAFIKEYDELIKKYQTLKEKKLAQSSTAEHSDGNMDEEVCPCDDVPAQKMQTKRSPRESCMKKTDATTCTKLSHRNVCCGNDILCANKATSPFPTPSVSKTDVSCQNGLISERSEVSERLLGQVRKAFAKEYEDITRRLDNIKCNCECMIKANSELTETKPLPKASYSTELYSTATSQEECKSTNKKGKSGFPCIRPNTDSSTALKSEDSVYPGPLSSQEYIMICDDNGKDASCKCKHKCVCSQTSSARQRSKAETAYSSDAATSPCARERHVESEKCRRCKDKCTCRPGNNMDTGSEAKSSCYGVLSPTSVESIGTSHEKFANKKCRGDCTCHHSKSSASVSKSAISSSCENVYSKRTDDSSVNKCRCCSKATCNKPKADSTEPATSARSYPQRHKDPTHDGSVQKIIDRLLPMAKSVHNNSTPCSPRNKDCVKGCACTKCERKQQHSDQTSSTNKRGRENGNTFRKKCSATCKCSQQAADSESTQSKQYQREARQQDVKRVQINPCKDKCKSCCSKCTCRKKKDSSTTNKKRDVTSDDSVVMCLWCKAIPINSSCRICNGCLRKHQQYVENVIQRKKYICKAIPKAVAYNLIVESSESILEETVHNKPKCLEKVVIKVAKIKGKKNGQRALDLEECCHEDKGSTDEQIRELSSLNSERNKCNTEEDQVPECDEKTLRDMLEENRPDFVCNTNCRQEILKKYNAVRQQRDAEQRRVLLKGVRTLPNINQDILNRLECIAREYGFLLPKSSINNNFKVFDTKQMIKEGRRKYQKLPEVEKKKINKRKQDCKKTNLVMADIFSKKLQRKTLRGIVDISHSRQIISL